MLRETKTKVIDGQEYQVTQLGAIKGSQVFIRLLKVLGVFAGDNLGEALGNLKEDDVEYLMKAFQPYTTVNGVPLDGIFDVHFAGKYKAMFEWLLFSVEVNFGNFLGKSDLLGAVAAKVGSVSPSQTVATGPSGGSS